LFVVAWVIYIVVIACYTAYYGFARNGVEGIFLGLVIGVVAGAMSATMWAFIFYLLLKFGGFISRLLKRP
jgi:hypothetical protein